MGGQQATAFFEASKVSAEVLKDEIDSIKSLVAMGFESLGVRFSFVLSAV